MASPIKSPSNRKKSNLWKDFRTGRWHWDVSLTRRDGTVYRRAGSRKTEVSARVSRDQAFAEFNQSEGRAGRWTLKAWTNHVREQVWPGVLADTTIQAYDYALKNHALGDLGSARLDGLTVPFLQEWVNRTTEKIGPNAASTTMTALSSLLTRAVEAGVLASNPARYVRVKKSEEPETKMILTAQEQKLLVDASMDTPMELPIFLGLRFGLRMGECLGLRWDDVDLDEKVLIVRQQAQYVAGKGIQLTKPKSKHGTRRIPIPDALVPVLATYRAESDSVFVCTRGGDLISSKKASHFFRTVTKEAGFGGAEDERGVPTHHDLRSTFLSFLANHANGGKGVKPHVLMAIAGHSNLETTMKYYVRTEDEDLRAAMASVSG